MKALVGAFNQEKALVGAFSVIVQPVVEPTDRFTALDQEEEEAPAGDGVDYQQLEAPLYAGEQEGLRIARSYTQPEPGGQQGARQCRVCGYRGKGAQVATHVLAQHLPAVHLYR